MPFRQFRKWLEWRLRGAKESGKEAVHFANASAIGLYVPFTEKFTTLEISPDDWDFFVTVGMVYGIVTHSRAAHPGERTFEKAVFTELHGMSSDGLRALQDCRQFVDDRIGPEAKWDDMVATVGLWVLWNLLKRAPAEDRRIPSHGIPKPLRIE